MMRKLLLILVAGVVLSGCTSATPVTMRKVDQGLFSIDVPFLWRILDDSWRKPNTILAYGDAIGPANRESIVIYRMVNVFAAGSTFDEQFCREYFRLANSESYYSTNDSKVNLTNLVAADASSTDCEVYYTWSPENQATVNGVDYLVLKGTDLYVVEGSSVDGNDFETVKQAVLSFQLK